MTPEPSPIPAGPEPSQAARWQRAALFGIGLFLLANLWLPIGRWLPDLSPPSARSPDRSNGTPTAGIWRSVAGPTGHTSIGIDDERLSGVASSAIPWHILGSWEVGLPSTIATPPAEVQRLDGQVVTLIGFMFPLVEGERVTAFLLMASTQTCCYGPRPQFNQFVLVESAQPVPFVRLQPVKVTGRLFLEPRPQEGYIYRLESQQVEVIKGDPAQFVITSTTSSPTATATGSGVAGAVSPSFLDGAGFDSLPRPEMLPWWSALAEVQTSHQKGKPQVPPFILERQGSRVSIYGYLAGAFRDPQGGRYLLVGKEFWDGCCTGVPPTPFNCFLVHLASEASVPALSPLAIYQATGKLEVQPDDAWTKKGVLWLHDATIGIAPPANGKGG